MQGIIGSAELIENGMVKPENLPRFVGHIHAEAARLVTLIDDIIRLSQLDEGDAMPTEPVDLLAVLQEAAENLHDAASSLRARPARARPSVSCSRTRDPVWKKQSGLPAAEVRFFLPRRA